MQEIIKPLDKETVKTELKKIRFIKTTYYGHNELYSFEYKQSPLLMQEVGRLREITFRASGGGTGLSTDIDKYDTCKRPFSQLIVWNTSSESIIGGYRYLIGPDVNKEGEMLSPTGKLFKFSHDFHKIYTPYMMELGRSFVIPEYQATSDTRKGLAALDNLWDGIGTIIAENKDRLKYFFGKFTMYRSYNLAARDILLHFLDKYFHDSDLFCVPKIPINIQTPIEEIDKYFSWDNYQDDYKELNILIKDHGENIPPLVSSYMNLTNTMKYFGTTLNPGFGNVEESGILLTIGDMKPSKFDRYILQNMNINNK